MSITHIQTIELASSQASITFSSIPQDYTDLMLKVAIRSDRNAEGERFRLVFNSDTSSNYIYKALYGTGSSDNGEGITTNGIINYAAPGSTATSNTFSNTLYYILNYTISKYKAVSSDGIYENNGTTGWQNTVSGMWNSNAAITSIEIVPDFANGWVAGSTVTLYGITAGGDGTVTTA